MVDPCKVWVLTLGKLHIVVFINYKRGVCRPLEEESSFCLGLSTRPVSEIVPVCLNPRFLVLITLL